MILITGSDGFIGSFLTQSLLQKGYKVIGVDHRKDKLSPLKENRVGVFSNHERFEFFNCDLCEFGDLVNIFNKWDFSTVFHCSGAVGVGNSFENPNLFLTQNIIQLTNVLECIKRFGTERIVFPSSAAVYAESSPPFREDDLNIRPLSPYGVVKKTSEDLCYAYHKLYGIDTIIYRYFSIYGPQSNKQMAIYQFISSVLEDRIIKVVGGGEQKRDMVFIDDIVRGTLKALSLRGFHIINLAGGQKPISILNIIKEIEKIMGVKANLDFLPNCRREDEITWGNIDKAKTLLKWSPTIPFNIGLAKTIEWFKINKGIV